MNLADIFFRVSLKMVRGKHFHWPDYHFNDNKFCMPKGVESGQNPFKDITRQR